MLLNILLLALGLAMVLYGANWLTDGGSALAKCFGLSEMIIGLTVVAFGTSAPELAISVVSAIEGKSELAIGNVVGSNIANVLLIIGLVAMVRPIAVRHSVMANEIPLMIVASTALLACCLLPDTHPASLTRTESVLFLLFFAIFMRYTFSQGKKGTPAPTKEEVRRLEEVAKSKDTDIPLWKSLLYIAAGLGALVWGGDIFVKNASGLASAWGVNDAVIALTVVALGTSLPEIATSVVAARKGHSDLAVGNVIGSCVFNIFMVLGVSGIITPLTFGNIGAFDLLTMTGAAILFWIAGWMIGRRVITRGEGAVFLLLYITYTVILVIQA